MYYIAPLLFWACAEMTCGFFILGVPCIPCLVKSSGLHGKFGNSFGVSHGSSNNRSAAHRERYARALSNLPKISKHDLYSNLDKTLDKTQDDLPIYTVDRSESRQSLGDGLKDGSNFEVLCKTETTIVRSDLCSRDRSGDELRDRVAPWDAHNGSSQLRNYSRYSY